MGTVKGNGTGARRRTKSAKIQTDINSQGSNGSSAHNGAADAGLNTETIRMRAYDLFLSAEPRTETTLLIGLGPNGSCETRAVCDAA